MIDNSNESIWKQVEISSTAANTSNPIRKLVDRLKISPPPGMDLISLALGSNEIIE